MHVDNQRKVVRARVRIVYRDLRPCLRGVRYLGVCRRHGQVTQSPALDLLTSPPSHPQRLNHNHIHTHTHT